MEPDLLSAYLAALDRHERYRVEGLLKASPHETTEVVSLVEEDGSVHGPLIRKRINAEAAMGNAYIHLWEAQRAGHRFAHLPRIHDAFESGNEVIVVMDRIAGKTLRDEVYERDPSPELAYQWFPPLCEGMIELHERFDPPIIHRDLKPTNVIVGESGLTIIDLGIARVYRAGARNDTNRFGTPSYAPPEQYGYGQTDERSDVYALGMILYYLLTEKDPDPALSASAFNVPEVPPLFQPVLARACAFDPAARFPSVRALRDTFLQVAEMTITERPEARREGIADVALTTGKTPSVRVADPSKRSGIPAGLARAGRVVGMVWDIALMLFWSLLAIACFGAAIMPNEADATLPLWYRLLEYLGFGLLLFSGVAYALLDKRPLRRLVPALRGQTFLRGLIPGAVIVGAALLSFLLCILCSALGWVVLPSSA